jgi:hypothetical protein
MTWNAAAAGIAHPQRPPDQLQAAPARPGHRHLRLCPRCGGVGTHYLTCPSLRLPAGRHAGQDPAPERPGSLVPGRAGG